MWWKGGAADLRRRKPPGHGLFWERLDQITWAAAGGSGCGPQPSAGPSPRSLSNASKSTGPSLRPPPSISRLVSCPGEGRGVLFKGQTCIEKSTILPIGVGHVTVKRKIAGSNPASDGGSNPHPTRLRKTPGGGEHLGRSITPPTNLSPDRVPSAKSGCKRAVKNPLCLIPSCSGGSGRNLALR
jgi:hypothetical protein